MESVAAGTDGCRRRSFEDRPCAGLKLTLASLITSCSIGGMCGAIVTSPLDVVKTRLQSDMYTSKVSQHAAAHLTKNKGIVAGAARLAYHFVETGHLLRCVPLTKWAVKRRVLIAGLY